MSESYAGKINRKLLKKRRIINAAAGREPSDLVLKNATYVNVFSNELCHADIAVAEGLIVGMGQYSGTVEEDCTGKIVLPGFLDAHIHLESSLVSPKEFVKAVQNALRYFPKKYHELLAPEFANELKTYGHIYMYRWVVSRGGHSQFLPHGVRDEGVPPEHVPRQVPAGCLHPAHDHEQPRRQVATALETEA